METFQQPKIAGYRQLNAQEAALMNEVKEHAEQTRALVTRVQHYLEEQARQPLPEGHAPQSQVTNPARWAALAQIDLQTGYTKLVRAIAQPTTF